MLETQVDCYSSLPRGPAAGCAAGRAFRAGQEAARAGDWDAAVTHFTKAVQENPDNAEYKIELERAMQNAAREHIARARELEAKDDQLDAALIEYRRAVELDASNRLAAAQGDRARDADSRPHRSVAAEAADRQAAATGARSCRRRCSIPPRASR